MRNIIGQFVKGEKTFVSDSRRGSIERRQRLREKDQRRVAIRLTQRRRADALDGADILFAVDGKRFACGAAEPGAILMQHVEQQRLRILPGAVRMRTGFERGLRSENQFALANAPAMLQNVLAGQRCVLVLAPGAAPSVTSGTAQALQTAGAKVTGQLQMQAAFFDTSAATSSRGHAAQTFQPLRIKYRIFRPYSAMPRNRSDTTPTQTLPLQSAKSIPIPMASRGLPALIVGFAPRTVV